MNDVCRAYEELETVDVVVHDSAMHSAGQRTLVLIKGSTEYSKSDPSPSGYLKYSIPELSFFSRIRG